MTVPRTHEESEQARREQRAHVQSLIGMLLEPGEQFLRVEHARAGCEAGDVALIVLVGWTKLEPPKRAAKVGSELAQQWIIGKDNETRRDVKNLRRVEQPSDD